VFLGSFRHKHSLLCSFARLASWGELGTDHSAILARERKEPQNTQRLTTKGGVELAPIM
jgi:hypothetical protein